MTTILLAPPTKQEDKEMTDLFGHKEMKALSWKQPFATLMLHGKIETRTWNTSYRGLVLICASKIPYSVDQNVVISGYHQMTRITNLFLEHDLAKSDFLGYAIAVGELVDCRPMVPEDEDDCFVRWDMGLYCHIYKNVRAIDPIPFKGRQGWTKLTPDFVKKLKYI